MARLRNAATWFVGEFLVLPLRLELISMLTVLSRIVAVSTILGLLFVQLRAGLAQSWPAIVIQCGLCAMSAVMIGNIVKEVAFSIAERIARALERDFTRSGVTFTGKRYRFVQYVDGTWMRCESGPHGTVCEWMDTFGACNRIETSAMSPPLRKPDRAIR
jgi:hypothetical protein